MEGQYSGTGQGPLRMSVDDWKHELQRPGRRHTAEELAALVLMEMNGRLDRALTTLELIHAQLHREEAWSRHAKPGYPQTPEHADILHRVADGGRVASAAGEHGLRGPDAPSGRLLVVR